jgi:hypothetical protein
MNEYVEAEVNVRYIEFKVDGEVIDRVEITPSFWESGQGLAEIKARIAHMNPEVRALLIEAVRELWPQIEAEVAKEIYAAPPGEGRDEAIRALERAGVGPPGVPDAVFAPIRELARSRIGEDVDAFYSILGSRCPRGSLEDLEEILAGVWPGLVDIPHASREPDVTPKDYQMGAMKVSADLARKMDALWNEVRAHSFIDPPPIPVMSGFRPFGVTAGSGGLRDEHGKLDATDTYGHWKGKAVDLRTKDWRSQCNPPISLPQLDEFAANVGLERPWPGGKGKHNDPQHWSHWGVHYG